MTFQSTTVCVMDKFVLLHEIRTFFSMDIAPLCRCLHSDCITLNSLKYFMSLWTFIYPGEDNASNKLFLSSLKSLHKFRTNRQVWQLSHVKYDIIIHNDNISEFMNANHHRSHFLEIRIITRPYAADKKHKWNINAPQNKSLWQTCTFRNNRRYLPEKEGGGDNRYLQLVLLWSVSFWKQTELLS